VTLSDESYGALLIKVDAFYQSLKGNWSVQTSHFLSDRYAKKAYYFAVMKEARQK
jgi:hypothetical protein